MTVSPLLLFLYRSLKCSSCEKQFNNRVELRSHNKIHETSMWNASGTNGNADNSDMHRSRVVNSHSRTSDVAMESDSAVSEKVLLDTVAEREVMNQVEVSGSTVSKVCDASKRDNERLLLLLLLLTECYCARVEHIRGEKGAKRVHEQMQVLPKNFSQTERSCKTCTHTHRGTAVQVRLLQQELRREMYPGFSYKSSYGKEDISLSRVQ